MRHSILLGLLAACTPNVASAGDPDVGDPVADSHSYILHRAPVLFPQELWDDREYSRAQCAVRVHIDETGAPTELTVSGCPEVFHAAVRGGVMQWRWSPAVVDGAPTGDIVEHGVNFIQSTRERAGQVAVARLVSPPGPDGVRTFHRSELTMRQGEPEGEAPPKVKPSQSPQQCTSTVHIDATGAPVEIDVAGCSGKFQRDVRSRLGHCRWEPPVWEGEPVEARMSHERTYR